MIQSTKGAAIDACSSGPRVRLLDCYILVLLHFFDMDSLCCRRVEYAGYAFAVVVSCLES